MEAVSRLVKTRRGMFAHSSGALWIARERTAIVADAHLGYGWALRRRGQLGPVGDNRSSPKLLALLDELQPQTLVFLGDLVHAPRPGELERKEIEETLRGVAARARIIVVRGNHDRAFARDFGHLHLPVVESWESVGISARHGDRLSGLPSGREHLVVGHLHPIIRLHDAVGAGRRFPAFLHNRRVTLLPAFSPFSVGMDISRGLPEEWNELFRGLPLEVIAVTGNQAVKIAAQRS